MNPDAVCRHLAPLLRAQVARLADAAQRLDAALPSLGAGYRISAADAAAALVALTRAADTVAMYAEDIAGAYRGAQLLRTAEDHSAP